MPHILETRCGSCALLRRISWQSKSWCCPKNKQLNYVSLGFAEKCDRYSPNNHSSSEYHILCYEAKGAVATFPARSYLMPDHFFCPFHRQTVKLYNLGHFIKRLTRPHVYVANRKKVLPQVIASLRQIEV